MTLPDGLTRRECFHEGRNLSQRNRRCNSGGAIMRYLLSPVSHEQKGGYESWVSLGDLEQFPSGQTRFATYRNPVVNPTDGDTADIACWVRNVDGKLSRYLRSTARHLGVLFAGFLNGAIHVPLPWRCVLPGRFSRLRPAGTWLVRIQLQN